MLRSNIKSYMK